MASASVSPAVPQPGSSGNTADQRLACGSNSTNNLNFIIKIITAVLRRSKATNTRNSQEISGLGLAQVGATGQETGNGGSGGARTRQKTNKIKGFEGLPSQIASQNSGLPAELQKVVDAWPDLSSAIRGAILAIVNAAKKEERP
jgi:hypothetical protein